MIEQQVFSSVSPFGVCSETLEYQTVDAPEFVDITEDVADAVNHSGIENGMVVVYSQHTTAAIKINESEPELIKDMARFLREIAPHDRDYCHNDFDVRTVNMEEDECPNAHAHCQHLMLNASETIPVLEGRMGLGRWQRLFLIELDRPKERQLTVQIIGV